VGRLSAFFWSWTCVQFYLSCLLVMFYSRYDSGHGLVIPVSLLFFRYFCTNLRLSPYNPPLKEIFGLFSIISHGGLFSILSINFVHSPPIALRAPPRQSWRLNFPIPASLAYGPVLPGAVIKFFPTSSHKLAPPRESFLVWDFCPRRVDGVCLRFSCNPIYAAHPASRLSTSRFFFFSLLSPQ